MLAFVFGIGFLENIMKFLKALEVLKNASQVEDLQNCYRTTKVCQGVGLLQILYRCSMPIHHI